MMILFTIINLVLAGADVVSDITLAIDYCTTDNPWWCGLTWAFLSVPLLLGILLVLGFLCTCCDDNDDDDEDLAEMFFVWKLIEMCFESGPQLVLQLYIMALSEEDPSSTSGILISSLF